MARVWVSTVLGGFIFTLRGCLYGGTLLTYVAATRVLFFTIGLLTYVGPSIQLIVAIFIDGAGNECYGPDVRVGVAWRFSCVDRGGLQRS